MIIGTAGHIDHGKTALVRALTGVDTDRLPEEQRRGITIELGFAPLVVAGIGTVGVVDVPGHEAFVRTMLAGATGVDVALLVIAADEGVMPQTREHLEIVRLLGVKQAVVALTKRDLVDDDWLALVTDDVRSFLAPTPFADAPILPVSARTGDGIDNLRASLADALRVVQSQQTRDAVDLFRMPVDRSFTIKGTGTVVTGTVWSGTIARDQFVRVHPGARSVRVRGIQTHGVQVDAAQPGDRAAIALAGVDTTDVPRGSVLTAGDGWQPSTRLRALVEILDDVDLGARRRLRFHLGTQDVAARAILERHDSSREASDAGRTSPARIVVAEPVLARAGDRFVLRSESPPATIGGGVVLDPAPAHRRVHAWGTTATDVAIRLDRILEESGPRGVSVSSLAVRLGLTPAAVASLLSAAGASVLVIDGSVLSLAVVERLEAQLRLLVDAHHGREPLEPGMRLQTLREALGIVGALADELIRRAQAAGDIDVDGGLVRRSGWRPDLSGDRRALVERLVALLEAADREPPSVSEVTAEIGSEAPALLRLLEREGTLVGVGGDRYYVAGAMQKQMDRLRHAMEPGRGYSPAELREILGVSRKFLIPFLEYCDRQRITDRRGDTRVLAGT